LARTYNKLGEFERARTTCLRALSVLKPEDFVLTGMYLIVQTEVLVAEAGLGRGGEAEGALRVLIAQHAPHGGPLTLGQLHEAGVEIALLSSDEAGARHHLAQAKRWYLSTGLASLVQHCAGLSARVQGAAQGTSGSPGSADRERRSLDPPSVDSSISSSTVDRMLAGDKLSLRERAHKALQILAEHARCTHGFLYLLDAQQNLDLVASLKDEPEVPSLRAWLARRLASEREEAPTLDDQDESNTQELHLMFDGTRSYRVLMLETADPVRQGVLGAAVVASTEGAPAACPAEVVAAVAFHLQRGLARASSASLLPG
ncbi:MAG: hypothetical protein JWN48_511, partial [Myxococcaceae bacterium]|nr:hypothetical protein [Myxococcaceae bacterium]